MATKMVAKIAKYWYFVHGIMRIAIILEQRYKFKLLEYRYVKYIYSLRANVSYTVITMDSKSLDVISLRLVVFLNNLNHII